LSCPGVSPGLLTAALLKLQTDHCLTNVIQPDPVGSIHFLLDVPGDDQVLAPVQRVLHSGGCEGGPAVGRYQVRVTVGPRKPDRMANDRDVIAASPPPLRQSPQVVRAERVPQVGAAPPWS